MNTVYNYINAANRHGQNRDHTSFVNMVKMAAKEGNVAPIDAINLFKAFRRGFDTNFPPSAAVVHHPHYGSLTKKQWDAQLDILRMMIIVARRRTTPIGLPPSRNTP